MTHIFCMKAHKIITRCNLRCCKKTRGYALQLKNTKTQFMTEKYLKILYITAAVIFQKCSQDKMLRQQFMKLFGQILPNLCSIYPESHSHVVPEVPKLFLV